MSGLELKMIKFALKINFTSFIDRAVVSGEATHEDVNFQRKVYQISIN